MKVIYALILLHISVGFVQGQNEGLSMKPYSNIHDDKVSLLKVLYNDTDYGYSIWMNRTNNPGVKTKYFAYRNGPYTVYERFNSWNNDNRNIIFVMSGAFYNSKYKPVGLTIDHGRVVNRGINETMDGLVIVDKNGEIEVSNLEDKNIYVSDLGDLNIRNAYDKERFIQWATEEEATVFQIQLLVYKNEIKCAYHSEYRERRLLVIAKDTNEDTLHVVFDMDKSKGVSLYDISEKILNYFKHTNREIIAMLNLDVGRYDILSVRSKSDKELHAPRGSRNEYLSKTGNLVVFYY